MNVPTIIDPKHRPPNMPNSFTGETIRLRYQLPSKLDLLLESDYVEGLQDFIRDQNPREISKFNVVSKNILLTLNDLTHIILRVIEWSVDSKNFDRCICFENECFYINIPEEFLHFKGIIQEEIDEYKEKNPLLKIEIL